MSLIQDILKKQYAFRSYNNIDISYLLTNTDIYTHLDKIEISFDNIVNYEKQLFTFLENNNFNCYKETGTNKKSEYKRIRKYNICGSNTFILYRLKPYYQNYKNMPPMRIIVHDPNSDTLKWIKDSLDLLEFDSKLSLIEMAIDFAGPIYDLQYFFFDHLFLKRHQFDYRFVGHLRCLDEYYRYKDKCRVKSGTHKSIVLLTRNHVASILIYPLPSQHRFQSYPTK